MRWIHAVFLSHALVVVLVAVVLYTLAGKARKTRVEYAAIALLIAIIGWTVASTVSEGLTVGGRPSDFVGSIGALFGLAVAFLSYLLYELFPDRPRSRIAHYRLLGMSVVSLIVTPLVFTKGHIAGRVAVNGIARAQYGPFFPFVGGWMILTFLIGVAILTVRYRIEKSATIRAQMRSLIFGMLIALCIGTAVMLILPVLGRDEYFFLGMDSTIVFVVAVVYAILAHGLMDVQAALRRFLVRLGISLLVGVTFPTILWVPFLGGAPHFSWNLAGTASVLFLCVMLFGRFLMEKIEALFLSGSPRMEQIVVRLFHRQFMGTAPRSLSIFMGEILDGLDETIGYRRAFLLVMDRRNRPRLVHRGDLPKAVSSLSDRLVLAWHRKVQSSEEYLAELDRILVLDGNPDLRIGTTLIARKHGAVTRLFRSILKELHLAGYSLFLPLVFQAEVCGYLSLGEKRNGAPYYAEDLALLEGVRLSVALAVRNKSYFEEIQELKTQAETQVVQLTDLIRRDASRRIVMEKIFVYQSEGMERVMKAVSQAAGTDRAVLIQGETGTGKELIARIIHDTARSGRPFVAVNCGAIPGPLWEDELFGHVAGAFTDARSKRPGRVAEAANGTLFFDEIGETPLEMQSKLLRLVQEGVYTPVGGQEEQKVASRFLFATNRDIQSMVGQGLFREDLYHRISTFSVLLPPLRQRRSDVPLLAEHFLRVFCEEFRLPLKSVSNDALEALQRHSWPGNIRELENVLMRAIASVPGETITAADLQMPIAGRVELGTIAEGPSSVSAGPDFLEEALRGRFEDALQELRRMAIREALRRARGNKTKAGLLLGIDRNKLRRQLQELRVDA